MNLYEACAVLGVWHVVKARVEVWSMSPGDHTTALNELKSMVKDKFKELALEHHPDKGGNNEVWIKIQEAHDLIKSATIIKLMGALDIERKSSVKYCAPGSAECKSCSKWSDLANVCATSSCSGFKEYETPVFSEAKAWRKRPTVQNSSFFSGGSQELGRKAG